MILKGRYYMHDKSMDVCVQIVDSLGNGMYKVQWWNLGYVGTPWPIDGNYDEIYMHPDVWNDITENLQLPREKWS